MPRSLHDNNVTIKTDLNVTDKDRLYVLFIRARWATDYTGNLTPTGTALPLPYNSSSGIVVEVPTIAQIDLITEGRVPGIDQEQFAEYAGQAKAGCPVSRALAGVGEINLDAKLVN